MSNHTKNYQPKRYNEMTIHEKINIRECFPIGKNFPFGFTVNTLFQYSFYTGIYYRGISSKNLNKPIRWEHFRSLRIERRVEADRIKNMLKWFITKVIETFREDLKSNQNNY